jgi:hypothetical protein
MTVTLPTNDENNFGVKVRKPVWCKVKGLRLKDFKHLNHNPLTKLASLPIPLDQ